MTDQPLSWRRQPPISSSPLQYGLHPTKAILHSKGDSKYASNWRAKGSSPGKHHQQRAFPKETPDNDEGITMRLQGSPMKGNNGINEKDRGPAVPLFPLRMGLGRPLPHPSTYAGADNWALTPTSSIPSLPATPVRAMQILGWAHDDESNRDASTSTSKGLSAARANLNRRNEDTTNLLQTRILSPTMNASAARNSPQRRPGQVASSPAIKEAQAASLHSAIRPISPNNNNRFASPPPLRHKDSSLSVASSSRQSLGTHALSHSRRTSQTFLNSPASSVTSSAVLDRPGYRVYRPPHLRRKDSIHALKPKVSHYDRVRTPSLRGQSRSPDLISLLGRTSQDGSGTPSDTASQSSSRPQGRRRLSSLGTYNTSIYDDSSRGAVDSRSLFAKLAASNLRKASDASSHRPDDYYLEEEKPDIAAISGDFDLSVEDLMMETRSLTDEFCLSRVASSESNRPVVDIFQVGDRLGPGMMHDGLEITIAETTEGYQDQNADLTGSQLEVIKKLGEGSYAVVYLVKEVSRMKSKMRSDVEDQAGAMGIPQSETIREMEHGDETIVPASSMDLYGTTLKANSEGRLLPSQEQDDPKSDKDDGCYFALKCLCKRDLSDEMLQVQRLEATIHQSIPKHPHIVTLHRTYETAEWLFLILEYCPGQDLFFWLEQAHDTNNLEVETPMLESIKLDTSHTETAIDSTPPSPSLLASTGSRFLLSSRRLRLISRMFIQMCDAIQFCHDRGISHRDIKPENFIVEDTRETASHDSIQVKLTDFGLAVAQEQCIDFDCGSKPYMSFECRNNQTRWYDPKQSDIWSLGIVLLNLIFHRNPFSEPNVDKCSSFATYVEDPTRFLYTAFCGIKWEAAEFLAENVFCDVTKEISREEEDEEVQQRRRISAREFAEWASNLSQHMEMPFHLGGGEASPHGADERITSPIAPCRSPSSVANSIGASPIGAGNRLSVSGLRHELASMGIEEEEWKNFDSLFEDKVTKESVEDGKESQIQQPAEEAADIDPEEVAVLISESTESSISVSEPNAKKGARTSAGNPKRRKRGARKGRTMTKQELKRSQSAGNLATNLHADDSRDDILRELAEASQTLAREMSRSTRGDTVTHLTWQDGINLPNTTASFPSLSNLGRSTSNGNGMKESLSGLPAPPIMTAWRSKGPSISSTTTGSSYSDMTSIHSTVSAPAAFTSRRQISPLVTNSSIQSSSAAFSNGSGSTRFVNSRQSLASPTHLDTISERAAVDKKLDASYLAKIFGGRNSLDGHTNNPIASSASHSNLSKNKEMAGMTKSYSDSLSHSSQNLKETTEEDKEAFYRLGTLPFRPFDDDDDMTTKSDTISFNKRPLPITAGDRVSHLAASSSSQSEDSSIVRSRLPLWKR